MKIASLCTSPSHQIAFWEKSTLVIERCGPQGRFREERYIDEQDQLHFKLTGLEALGKSGNMVQNQRSLGEWCLDVFGYHNKSTSAGALLSGENLEVTKLTFWGPLEDLPFLGGKIFMSSNG